MKNIPKKIYLQIDPDNTNPNEFPLNAEDVTWCRDRVNKSDVEYVINECEQEQLHFCSRCSAKKVLHSSGLCYGCWMLSNV